MNTISGDTSKRTDRRIEDCWNKIGVWGNQECPELERVIHCRNCPVYSSAAARLLDENLQIAFSKFAKCDDERDEQIQSGIAHHRWAGRRRV